MQQPRVSCIITTRNERRNIVRLFRSIQAQDYSNIEIIIVDNSSVDDTKTLAKPYGAVYNKGPERSAQRNYGAHKATGDYVLFLDADMELTSSVVSTCVQHMKNHVALIIPELSKGRTYWERVKALERNCYINDPDMELPRFYPRTLFLQLGGFDEQITGPEIEELYYRALQKGTVGRIDSFIIHYEQVSQLKNILKKKYYYCKSLDRYFKRSPSLARKQFKIIRPAFVHHWKDFLFQPHLTLGFILLRCLEGCAALLGMYMGKKH